MERQNDEFAGGRNDLTEHPKNGRRFERPLEPARTLPTQRTYWEYAVGQHRICLPSDRAAVKPPARRSHKLDTHAPRRAPICGLGRTRLKATTGGHSAKSPYSPSSFTSSFTGIRPHGGSRHEFPLDPSGSTLLVPGHPPRPGPVFSFGPFRGLSVRRRPRAASLSGHSSRASNRRDGPVPPARSF
jgi:hypothetical protein